MIRSDRQTQANRYRRNLKAPKRQGTIQIMPERGAGMVGNDGWLVQPSSAIDGEYRRLSCKEKEKRARRGRTGFQVGGERVIMMILRC